MSIGAEAHRPAERRSALEEEILEALMKLAGQTGALSPSDLASRLRMPASSVSSALDTLQAAGLVGFRAERIGLTADGRLQAAHVVRRHRLAERLLTDVLGVPWDSVHDEACEIEHVLSQQSEDGLARLLPGVETCPHGHPIPDKDGNLPEQDDCCLLDLRPQECARIVSVGEDSQSDLRHLAALGLLPGVEVRVEEKAPFSGPIMISVGPTRYALDRRLARSINVSGPFRHRRRHRGGSGR